MRRTCSNVKKGWKSSYLGDEGMHRGKGYWLVTDNPAWSIIVRTEKNLHSFLPGIQKTVPRQALRSRITGGSLTTCCRQSNDEQSRKQQALPKTANTICRAISPCPVRLETIQHLFRRILNGWFSRNNHSAITWPGARKHSAMGITWKRLVALMVGLVIKRSLRAFARCAIPREKIY